MADLINYTTQPQGGCKPEFYDSFSFKPGCRQHQVLSTMDIQSAHQFVAPNIPTRLCGGSVKLNIKEMECPVVFKDFVGKWARLR